MKDGVSKAKGNTRGVLYSVPQKGMEQQAQHVPVGDRKLAQLVERFPYKEKVIGSNPILQPKAKVWTFTQLKRLKPKQLRLN